jgi:hypothetical protein
LSILFGLLDGRDVDDGRFGTFGDRHKELLRQCPRRGGAVVIWVVAVDDGGVDPLEANESTVPRMMNRVPPASRVIAISQCGFFMIALLTGRGHSSGSVSAGEPIASSLILDTYTFIVFKIEYVEHCFLEHES